jgi:hypothetical protein
VEYTSLHLETTDMTGVEIAVEAILEPGWNVYLAPSKRWTSVFFSHFEGYDAADLEQFVTPLSIVYRTIVLVGDDEDNHYFEYRHGRCIDALVGEIGPRVAELEIPTALAFTDFDGLQELEYEDELSDDIIKLEREPEKPGLAEFFGRSEDE